MSGAHHHRVDYFAAAGITRAAPAEDARRAGRMARWNMERDGSSLSLAAPPLGLSSMEHLRACRGSAA